MGPSFFDSYASQPKSKIKQSISSNILNKNLIDIIKLLNKNLINMIKLSNKNLINIIKLLNENLCSGACASLKVSKFWKQISSQNFFQKPNQRICVSILTTYQDRKTNSMVQFLEEVLAGKSVFDFYIHSIFHWSATKKIVLVSNLEIRGHKHLLLLMIEESTEAALALQWWAPALSPAI